MKSRLLAHIDHSRLHNLDNLAPSFRRPAWDPNLQHSVPYMWGATGIIYQKTLSPAPDRWASLWSPQLKGRLTMLDDPAEVLGAALKKLGFSLNSENPDELAAAKKLLRAYLDAEVRDQLVAGDVLAAQLWTTTSAQAMQASGELGFAFPAEGFPLYADCAAVLAESPRQVLAHTFIDYLLRPDVAAEIASATRTATANAQARALLSKADHDDQVLYPGSDVLNRGEWFRAISASGQQLRDRIWTEIKSA